MLLVKTLVIKQPEARQLLREIRSHVGVTQEQLALHLGVTFSTINRWENQRGKPSPLAVQKLEAMLEQMGDRGRELLAQ